MRRARMLLELARQLDELVFVLAMLVAFTAIIVASAVVWSFLLAVAVWAL